MRYQSFVASLTLIAFLPLATGCSSRQTVRPADDTDASAASADLASGRTVRIAGYTLRGAETVEWDGEVQRVTADSLEFLPHRWPGQTRIEVDPGFRLALDEVESLEIVDPDTGRSIATFALVVALGTLALLVALLHSMSEAFDEDNWFQGPQ